VTDLFYPLKALKEGHWFKLICGASYQHLPAVHSLALAFSLAGADCIDVAADPAVIFVAKSAIALATSRFRDKARQRGYLYQGSPWLMVSFNDGEDPHFRKAEFDPLHCPSDCKRPCELVCPAQAITVDSIQAGIGVLSDRCYGCGRCLPICPIQHVTTRSHILSAEEIAALVLPSGVDAIEIHTQVGRLNEFKKLWQAIAPWVSQLKLVAISCPDGEELIEYLWALYNIVAPLPCPLVWQLDGRPMSGDIGAGTTHATIRLGQKVLAAKLPGYLQLAGGTNHYTVPKLRALGLLKSTISPSFELAHPARSPVASIAGVAYGSYARSLLLPILNNLEMLEMAALSDQRSPTLTYNDQFIGVIDRPLQLETRPELLWQAVDLAHSLIAPLKSDSIQPSRPASHV